MKILKLDSKTPSRHVKQHAAGLSPIFGSLVLGYNMYPCTCVSMHACGRARVVQYVRIHLRKLYVCACIHMHEHMRMHIHIPDYRICDHTCIYACVHMCICARVYVNIKTCTSRHICIHTYIYTHTYVCICVCVFTFLLTYTHVCSHLCPYLYPHTCA